MTDIVDWLRCAANEHNMYRCDEAADEIEKLREERNRLREALKDMDGYVSRADRYYLKPETLAALKEKE